MTTIPDSISRRIELVGRAIYGDAWRRRMAEALGVSRSTLWEVLREDTGRRRKIDLNAALLDLVDRERDELYSRALDLTRLRQGLTGSGAASGARARPRRTVARKGRGK